METKRDAKERKNTKKVYRSKGKAQQRRQSEKKVPERDRITKHVKPSRKDERSGQIKKCQLKDFMPGRDEGRDGKRPERRGYRRKVK